MSRGGEAFVGSSLVELLQVRAADQPDDRAYTFLRDGESEGATLTWAELERRSRAIAAELQARLDPGRRALLVYPPGLEFIAAFFGCLYAGVVAVPVLPPRAGRSNRGFERLAAIVADAGPAAALTTGDSFDRWPRDEVLMPRVTDRSGAAALTWLPTDRMADDAAGAWRHPGAHAGQPAFIQYTSGSTAEPKGVMVSHGNLLHNLAYACHLAENDHASVSVSWLPVTHDMGLIEGVLQPAFCGCPAYLMSPAAFLQRPVRWLRALSRYRATRSGAPNFAYDLAVRKVGVDQSGDLDLSAWRNAYNGAEPIRSETMAEFSAAFAHCGFRPSAFRPCYGLAEHTLLVSSGRWNGDASGPTVTCGTPALGTRVVIVDPDTSRPCGPGGVGEIWVAGSSVALGYWGRPEESARMFLARTADGDGPFLRTGDLGCVRAGELIVTGRLKDLLIVRGFKHFPQDLEHTAARQHPAIQPGSAVAIALDSDVSGDRIAVVVEAHARKLGGADDTASIIAAIRSAIAEDHGIQIHGVVIVAPGTVPKTTSGKLQRFACQQALRARTMTVLACWGDTVPAGAVAVQTDELSRKAEGTRQKAEVWNPSSQWPTASSVS